MRGKKEYLKLLVRAVIGVNFAEWQFLVGRDDNGVRKADVSSLIFPCDNWKRNFSLFILRRDSKVGILFIFISSVGES